MVDRIKCLGIIYCDCCGSGGWFVLVEALGYCRRQGKEGCGGRVALLESVLGGVGWKGLGERWEEESFEDLDGRAEQGDGPVGSA